MKNFELNTLDWNEGTPPPELASTNNSLSIVIKGTVVSLLYKQVGIGIKVDILIFGLIYINLKKNIKIKKANNGNKI